MARWWGFTGVVLGVFFAAATGARSANAADIGQAPHLIVSDRLARFVVARAIEGAQRRLGRPSCLQVLDDFTDKSGQRLSNALAATGRQASEYVVERIWFVDDGGTAAQCRRDGNRTAFTEAGSKVVHVCPERFAGLADRSTAAELLVIHELLHTLGLGENPPSGADITRDVTRRCGGS